MAENPLRQQAIEQFWDCVPPVWGFIRGNVRSNAVQESNLTIEQFHILRHIRKGFHSVGELAEQLQISRPAISQAIDLLVEKGLVTRQQDTQDRRFVQLGLTENGNNLLNHIFSKNRAWMAEKMASLSSEELETLIKGLSILKRSFSTPKE
jgi:DNA-binding MarR family transcriptional regulator